LFASVADAVPTIKLFAWRLLSLGNGWRQRQRAGARNPFG
jgi:hypothetical protein